LDHVSTFVPWFNLFSAVLMLWYTWLPLGKAPIMSALKPVKEVYNEEEQDEMMTFTAMLMGKPRGTVNTGNQVIGSLSTVDTKQQQSFLASPSQLELTSVNTDLPDTNNQNSTLNSTPRPEDTATPMTIHENIPEENEQEEENNNQDNGGGNEKENESPGTRGGFETPSRKKKIGCTRSVAFSFGSFDSTDSFLQYSTRHRSGSHT